MMRKLLIVAIVPILAATGCARDMRRMEVWKQRTLFAPSETVMVAPAAQPMYQAPPPATSFYQPAPPEMSVEAETGPALSGSPEEVNGVLEQQ